MPLNQLPPIVSPDGKLQSQHKKKNLFIPPIVQGGQASRSSLPPIVQGGSKPSGMNRPVIPPKKNLAPGIQSLPPIVQGESKPDPRMTKPLHSIEPMLPPPSQLARPTQLQPQINRPMTQEPLKSAPSQIVDYEARNRQVSTAGVPLFPPSPATVNNADFSGPTGTNVGQVGFPLTRQGSGTRNLPGNSTLPPIVSPGSVSPAGPQTNQLQNPNVSNILESTPFGQSPIAQDLPAGPSTIDSPIGQGISSDATPSANVMPPLPSEQGIASSAPDNSVLSTPGTNDYFSAPQVSAPTVTGGQVINSGCNSCENGNCYDLNQVQSQFGCCGSVVSAGYYLFADALIWTRGDGDIQLSNFFGLNDFSFEGGWRVTLGYRQNATRGRELTYFGTADLDDEDIRTSSNNSLASLFTVSTAFGLGGVNGFTNGSRHEHSKTSSVHSLEFNRVNWSWDVLKTMIGVRYVYFDDTTRFFSTNGLTGQNGLLTMDSVNNLFGVSGGVEAFYDVGYRTSFSLTTKVGGYINSTNFDTEVFHFGSQILDQDVDETSFASTLEFGALSHFQLRPQTRFRLGYDVMLLWGLFTVENNAPRNTFTNGLLTGTPFLSPTTGTDLNTNNDVVVFHGLSLGFEVYR